MIGSVQPLADAVGDLKASVAAVADRIGKSADAQVLQPGRLVRWSAHGRLRALCVEDCIVVDGHGVLVSGWQLASGEPMRRFGLCIDGESLLDPREHPRLCMDREDVRCAFADEVGTESIPPGARLGFCVFLPAPTLPASGVVTVVCEDDSASRKFVAVPQRDDNAIRSFVARQWPWLRSWLAEYGVPHLGPAWIAALVTAAPADVDPRRLRLAVDYAVRIPGGGPLLSGWWIEAADQPLHLLACTSKGHSVELGARAVRNFRPDVYQALKKEYDLRHLELGFIARLPELEPFDPEDKLAIVCYTSTEILGVIPVQWRESDAQPMREIERLMSLFSPSHPEIQRILGEHIGPAVERLWRARARIEPRIDQYPFGPQPRAPELSIVVPIYGRWDFIEYQLALFRKDPDFQRHELLYVIDDPQIFEAVLLHMRNLYPLFEVPFRIVYAHENRGFAGANNVGAACASGEFLLLLNSDVMPRSSGWTQALVASFKRLPNPGALGPRLLYQDGSIQHAGMRFVRAPHCADLWINVHPGKGQPAATDPYRAPVEVEAVTGACMLIPRAIYHEVGGFDEDYVIGDFEDSDLCLKLRQRGYRIYYEPGVELYHLERQSQHLIGDPSLRGKITLYNGWRHSRRWGQIIAQHAGGAHG